MVLPAGHTGRGCLGRSQGPRPGQRERRPPLTVVLVSPACTRGRRSACARRHCSCAAPQRRGQRASKVAEVRDDCGDVRRPGHGVGLAIVLLAGARLGRCVRAGGRCARCAAAPPPPSCWAPAWRDARAAARRPRQQAHQGLDGGKLVGVLLYEVGQLVHEPAASLRASRACSACGPASATCGRPAAHCAAHLGPGALESRTRGLDGLVHVLRVGQRALADDLLLAPRQWGGARPGRPGWAPGAREACPCAPPCGGPTPRRSRPRSRRRSAHRSTAAGGGLVSRSSEQPGGGTAASPWGSGS